MKAYKLMKIRKNGTLGPLFINARQVVPIGEWLPAGNHPTKGFAVRPGWHCCAEMNAPHLSLKPANGPARVWCEVEIKGITEHHRPEAQGGLWYTAEAMRVVRIVNGQNIDTYA